MSSDRTKQICLWITINIFIYIYIYICISHTDSTVCVICGKVCWTEKADGCAQVFLMRIQSTLLRFWLMFVIVLVNQLPALRATRGHMRGYLMRNMKLETAMIMYVCIIGFIIYFFKYKSLKIKFFFSPG